MADIQHAAITDPYVHEPKGAASAGANTVYVSNGSGSGTWKVLDPDSIDYAGLLADIQADVTDGDLEVNGRYWLTTHITDVSTASSILVPVIRNSTVVSARVVLGGAITTANASVTFSNSAGASMGTPVTVAFAGSAKGTSFTFTATGNNVLTGPTWFEIATDGASDTAQPLYITVELSTLLNP